MEKHIIGENGISYTLGADGLYYPDLQLPEGTRYEIGRYGRMRWEYLKSYHRGQYIKLLLEGKLNDHLHEVDGECYERMELLMEQMKAEAGITEEKDISAMTLDEILEIQGITVAEIGMINDLQKAIKANKVITFLGGGAV